ncbi:MAG: thioredoxin-disulfide reductase [Candidatus Peregrinibacteria bacterium]|nr:thioredoxin-disulfide reductase [Candidatus Peregrinibacteria bacterium]
MKEKLIIIGSGPAGFTAAIYAARADLAPLVFEGGEPGGQLMGTTDVENFPGFPDGIMGPTLMSNMREQAQKFGAKTVFKTVDRVDFSNPKNLVLFAGKEKFETECVIIATGASARWLNLGKGEEKFAGKGYSACATCDGAFFRDKKVAVVGGGDSACEEAGFLTKFASKVYLIVRRDELRASLPLQKRVKENEKIEILWNSSITDLRGENALEFVELKDNVSGEVKDLPLDGVFMAIGHTPNTKFLGEQLETKHGFLKVSGFTKTNIPSVFVAGDVSDPIYQQAISAAGAGCQAALDAERYLAKNS